MMKKLSIAGVICLLLMVLVSGCGKTPEKPQEGEGDKTQLTVRLYYGDAQNEKMVYEEREISFIEEEEKYRVVLEELIQGPQNQEMTANINKDAQVLSVKREGSDLTLDLSREFNTFAGSMAELMAVGSVVNTMTQFEEITRVQILIAGEELIGPSGEPRGFMTTFPTEPNGQAENAETEATLYFSNPNADKVVGERRTVAGSPQQDQEEFIRNALDALILGPEGENVYQTIPEGVKIQALSIEEGLLKVDFSEEMHTNHWGGAAGESMTINSIVNTVTEYDFIDRVLITVDQSPLAIEHIILDEPAERNEEIIAK
jgi:germination protein M